MGICLCLLFAIFPGYHFSRILSCKECEVEVGSVAQRAPLSGGYNQLKLSETEAGWWRRVVGAWRVGGGRREMCAANVLPSRFSLPRLNFICVPEMLGRWMLRFVQCSSHVLERKSQYFVMVLWQHYHINTSTPRAVCGEDYNGGALLEALLDPINIGCPPLRRTLPTVSSGLPHDCWACAHVHANISQSTFVSKMLNHTQQCLDAVCTIRKRT